jgi:ribosomal protection tetracycline resistance protein
VQKEIIEATLARDFGIEVTFSETTTICIERPIGVGEAVEWLGKEPNPFLATVGLRVEPGLPGTGVGFRLEIELGSMPRAFIKAVEETVRETLRQGLHGWQVLDIGVTLTHSRYLARQSSAHGGFDKNASSTAGDFRNLAPLVLMAALTEAGTAVHEPIHHFRLEIPADRYGALLPVLTRLRGIPDRPDFGRSTCVLEGEIPAAHVQQLHQQLLGLTRGEGVLESAFARYQEVTGVVPDRPRRDHNPLNRREYLLHVMRQV